MKKALFYTITTLFVATILTGCVDEEDEVNPGFPESDEAEEMYEDLGDE
ncbi:hypothetical protein [Bacillus sp. FJAT-45350]|nr:hypothetical protein [Bacillus sp. FJAT-45350]